MLREARGRVRENVPLWTMGLEQPVPETDRRAIELVALGLPLYHGLPLACGATVASPLHADGSARPMLRIDVDEVRGKALGTTRATVARLGPILGCRGAAWDAEQATNE